jgi:hypothetical protein
MKEVFIGYNKMTPVIRLKNTLEAWDTEEYEPVAIAIPAKRPDYVKYAAEGLAKGDYLIAELGTKPGDTKGVTECHKGKLTGVKVENCTPRVQ